MAFDFAAKCYCPSCFREIYLGECDIFSKTENRVLKTPKGPFARYTVERLDGYEYTIHHARRLCKECQYHLPYNIEDAVSMTLAVVGDTFSGKSHFLAALVHQIEQEWMSNANGQASITCLTPDVEKKYKQNQFDAIARGRSLNATQAAISYKATPLIYNIVRSESPRLPATTMNLMIYDAAGEDFYKDRLTEYARFVLRANAFIFVADPFTMKPVTDDLQISSSLRATWQPIFDRAYNRRAVDRLNDVMDLVQRSRKQAIGYSLPDTPVAVMLSKSDLLQHVKSLPAPQAMGVRPDPRKYDPNRYAFMQKPAYGNFLNITDLQQIDREARAVLTYYQQRSLLAATARFQQTHFFATSATGTIPDVNDIFPSVNPLRCLDPFLWILYCLKIIGGRRA
jgi:hypothetical protein